ncbi:carboxypeptidase-like regulatory domain-containing protein [Puia sp. P3]|uniref:carboxypeptidase-like regulatory domain-containing protein n=1 Tax=Puia sp. P3 TaxID=3423952 RepID=UPI003D67DF18
MQFYQDRLLSSKRSTAIWLMVVLSFLSIPVFAQNTLRVKGHVVNEDGKSVPKASVTVKGQKMGVACDEEGNFVISAPSNGVLGCFVRGLCADGDPCEKPH